MSIQDEIHAIKNSIIDMQHTINGLVRKIGNVSVLENQQKNDQEATGKLSEEVKTLTSAVSELNTCIATMNGIATGKRTMWVLFGSFITLSIVAIVTTVILHNSTLDVNSAAIKALKAEIKALQGVKV